MDDILAHQAVIINNDNLSAFFLGIRHIYNLGLIYYGRLVQHLSSKSGEGIA